MSVNFNPNRKKMSREIGLCVVLKRQDVLESFCSSCIFQIFENAEVRECFACEVRQAMNIIVLDGQENRKPADPGPQERAAASSCTSAADRQEATGERGDFLGRLMDYSKAMLLTTVLLCSVLFGGPAAAGTSPTTGAAPGGSTNVVGKILSVLQSRTTDRTILAKAADKLITMEERRLRIISSLCDRISEDSDAAGADIAFSLMTAMIVLS